jgi:branched-chain amino acid transport system substrate-binding protein
MAALALVVPTVASSAVATAATSKTITIGVLTDATGSASSGFTTTVQGIKAGIGVAATKGLKIKYVTADTQSTPAGALAGAQQLVQQDHVFAVVEVSSDFYGASAYLAAQHVPVIGGGFDGPEWSSAALTNLFDDIGSDNYASVPTTWGTFFKTQGVTNLAVVGYGISTASAGAASAASISAGLVGIKTGYKNLNFTFGSTDVQPLAIAMKAAGVNGLYAPVVPATGFALAAALSALGVKLKMIMLLTGYGGDLLASPSGVAAAQGIDFTTPGAPVEANTAGTRMFQSALKQYAGVTGIPTFAEYEAYLGIAGLQAGLLAAGANPTPTSFMTALRKVTHFTGNGLYGNHGVNFSKFGGLAGGTSPGNCIYVTKLVGKAFEVLKPLPTCGTVVAGKTADTGS